MINYLEGEGHVSSSESSNAVPGNLWDFDFYSFFALFFDVLRAAQHTSGYGVW